MQPSNKTRGPVPPKKSFPNNAFREYATRFPRTFRGRAGVEKQNEVLGWIVDEHRGAYGDAAST